MTKRTFKLTENDLTINTDKNIEMASGYDELTQALERAFTTNAGEWFLNALHGLEYPKIWGKGVTDEEIQLEVIRTALQEPRVREVDGIEITRNEAGRTADIVFHGIVETGETVSVPFTI